MGEFGERREIINILQGKQHVARLSSHEVMQLRTGKTNLEQVKEAK